MPGGGARRMLSPLVLTKESAMDRKSIARLALELTDRRDLAGRETLMTPDATFVMPGVPSLDPAGSSAYSRVLLAAFPDGRHQVDVAVEDGDHVVLEGTWTGTHTETLAFPAGDVPATGARINLPFTMVMAFDGDKARSVHVYFDQLTFLGQLGLLPVPQAA